MRLVGRICLGWFLLASGGCTSWKTQTTPLPKAMESKPDRIRLYSSKYGLVELDHPQLKADSVAGYSGSFKPKSVYYVVTLASIRYWELQEKDHAKSLGLTILMVPVVLLVAYLANFHPD